MTRMKAASSSPGSRALLILMLLLGIWPISSSAFVPSVQRRSSSAIRDDGLNMARFRVEFEKDYYEVLNVTRAADSKEVRESYLRLVKERHPDLFVQETKFDPGKLSIPQLKRYLESQRVGSGLLLEKQELVDKAWETYRRTQQVDEELQQVRLEIQNRFSLLNDAYNTLYDEKKRSMYNLSGDWGIPGAMTKKSTYKGTKGDMGDREEAARVRERQMAARRSPMQERLYQEYLKEQELKRQEEERIAKLRRQKKEEREELRRKRLAREATMTSEEVRKANQAKVKALWGDIFSNIFGSSSRQE